MTDIQTPEHKKLGTQPAGPYSEINIPLSTNGQVQQAYDPAHDPHKEMDGTGAVPSGPTALLTPPARNVHPAQFDTTNNVITFNPDSFEAPEGAGTDTTARWFLAQRERFGKRKIKEEEQRAA